MPRLEAVGRTPRLDAVAGKLGLGSYPRFVLAGGVIDWPQWSWSTGRLTCIQPSSQVPVALGPHFAYRDHVLDVPSLMSAKDADQNIEGTARKTWFPFMESPWTLYTSVQTSPPKSQNRQRAHCLRSAHSVSRPSRTLRPPPGQNVLEIAAGATKRADYLLVDRLSIRRRIQEAVGLRINRRRQSCRTGPAAR